MPTTQGDGSLLSPSKKSSSSQRAAPNSFQGGVAIQKKMPLAPGLRRR